jgi:hypothetical protein
MATSDGRSGGSAWWFAVMAELPERKHWKRLGTSLWAYLALHRVADFNTGWVNLDRVGVIEYFRERFEAPTSTLYRWRMILEDCGYIKFQGSGLQITNYRSARTFKNSEKQEVNSEKQESPVPIFRNASIIYKDLTYRSLKGFYEAAIASINQASNLMAELRALWIFIWGEEDAPDFGRLGRAAKRAGNGQSRPGARVLLRNAVVALVGRRVVGNPIDYVEKMGGGSRDERMVASGRSKQSRRSSRGVHAEVADEWAAPDHGDWGQFIRRPDVASEDPP